MRKYVGLVALAVIAVAGCSKPGLAGKWTMSGGQMAKSGGTATIDFTDSKYTMDIKFAQAGTEVGLKVNGAYKVEADKITMTTENVTVDDSKVPAQFKSALKSFLDPAKIKDQMNADPTSTFKLEGDKATLTGSKGESMTLTRVKA